MASSRKIEFREEGKAWEQAFKARGGSNGLLVLKNELSAHYIGGGGVRVTKADLDFRVIRRQDGRIGYFDCKTYHDGFFTFSDLNEKQVERAVLYNECNVPSGFIVWFRTLDVVSFYSGQVIQEMGSGTRFRPVMGRILGSLQDFDLRKAMGP